MSITLALFQVATESVEPTTFIILGVVALVNLAVIGLRFFRNLWETLIAPTASLGHIGQTNNFFVSMAVVFFSGLISAMILMMHRQDILNTFASFITDLTDKIALGGTSKIHAPDMAVTQAVKISSMFEFYFDLIYFLPIALVILWVFIGLFGWGATKMVASQNTFATYLGAVAYPLLFFNIGLALAMKFIVGNIGMMFQMTPTTPDIMGIIGIVLLLYGTVLYLIGVSRGMDLTGGQLAGVIIVLLIVIGGAITGIYFAIDGGYQSLTSLIQGYNPAN